jgi:serine/threonine protein kinase
MAKLCNGNHKNLVRVLGYGEFSDLSYAFIDMELCDLNLGDYNKSLWVAAKVDGDPEEAQIWNVMIQIASGLSYIHDSKTIHGDLKPSNGNRSPFLRN